MLLRFFACALLALVVPVAGCSLKHDGLHTQEFMDGLYLRMTPQPAEPGETVTFYVEGEPPTGLRVYRHADLLSANGDRLFRLDASQLGQEPPAPLAYPLPSNYRPRTGLAAFVAHQVVQIPRRIAPGRYTLQTDIVVGPRWRRWDGTLRSTPDGTIRIAQRR